MTILFNEGNGLRLIYLVDWFVFYSFRIIGYVRNNRVLQPILESSNN